MTDYVYHGRSPSDGQRWANSLQGFIDGEDFRIYEVEIPAPDEAREYRARNLYDLPGQVINEYTQSITGGLTANLGAAIKFHQSLAELGAVFILDPDRLTQNPQRIQYDYEWAEDHPGTYARIDSIDEFEVYEYGDLLGAGYHHEDGTPIVNKWTEQLRDRINDFAYADEAELACYDCDRIDFEPALFGTATYAHTSRAVGGSVQGALAEYPGYTMGFAGGSEEDVTRMDNAERAKALANVIARKEAGDLSVVGEGHRVVLYDQDTQRIRDEVTRIEEEAFILATDGSRVWRDYSAPEVQPYVGGK